MKEKTLDAVLETALEAAKQAGVFLLQRFGSTKRAHHRGGTHYGISEDMKADQVIREFLKNHSPAINVFSEEQGQLDPTSCWIVDALDGTSNYRVGIPLFAVQLALVQRGVPVVSVVYAPALQLMFSAKKDEGTHLNGRPAHVSDVTHLGHAMLSLNKGTQRKDLVWYGGAIRDVMNVTRTVRHFGSTGLTLALVSSGSIDAHIDSGSKLYDVVPGVLLVQEASGDVKNFDGNDWNMHDHGLVASNPRLIPKLLDILTLT